MAGEWIKVRTNLWDDTRVNQLIELTDTQEATVIGGLYWLWATADEHSEDGILPGMSLSGIDRKTGIKGFGNAMVTVGWISANGDGVTILRFDEHNGASAKSRAQTAKRVSSHKANAKVTHSPLPVHDCTVTSALPREDKIREEVKANTPIPPEGGGKPRKRASSISFMDYITECKAESRQPIPEGDYVFLYADGAGIPRDFLRLQWLEFKDRYGEPGAKKYKAWPTVFSKSVRGNWFKLWYADRATGVFGLTTTGIQAQQTHKEKHD